jgi:hypothetical protein
LNKDNKDLSYSNKLSIIRLVLLYILSFGLYQLYWYYRNWAQFKNEKNLNLRPIWLTVGLFIPVYNLFVVHNHFKMIKNEVKEKISNHTVYPGLYTLSYVVPGIFSFLLKLPNPYVFLEKVLYVIPLLPLIATQKRLNEYWNEKEQNKDFIQMKPFTIFEVILVISGFSFLIFDWIRI